MMLFSYHRFEGSFPLILLRLSSLVELVLVVTQGVDGREEDDSNEEPDIRTAHIHTG
jgi:hypothetical protein